MILHTLIPPRRDGRVVVRGGAATYVFVADSDGDLACDVSDETDVAELLATGRFYPANAADFPAAVALTDGANEATGQASGNEQPVEANTAPRPRKTRKAAGG